MRDSRITWVTAAPATINTATSTYGPTVDLKSGYVGDYFEGAPEGYGIGIEVMFTAITSTNNNVTLKWQVSDDDSNWYDDQQILKGELSALMGGGTKVIVPSRLETARRYVRLAVVTTGMGGSSFAWNAWSSDGTTDLGYGQPHLRV